MLDDNSRMCRSKTSQLGAKPLKSARSAKAGVSSTTIELKNRKVAKVQVIVETVISPIKTSTTTAIIDAISTRDRKFRLSARHRTGWLQPGMHLANEVPHLVTPIVARIALWNETIAKPSGCRCIFGLQVVVSETEVNFINVGTNEIVTIVATVPVLVK